MANKSNSENKKAREVTRLEALKLSGMAVGGLVVGGAVIGQGIGNARGDEDCQSQCPDGPACTWGDTDKTQQYKYESIPWPNGQGFPDAFARRSHERPDPYFYAQIDRHTEIPSCNRFTGECNYREDGY